MEGTPGKALSSKGRRERMKRRRKLNVRQKPTVVRGRSLFFDDYDDYDVAQRQKREKQEQEIARQKAMLHCARGGLHDWRADSRVKFQNTMQCFKCHLNRFLETAEDWKRFKVKDIAK